MRLLSQSNSRSRKKSPVNLKCHRTTRDAGLRTIKIHRNNKKDLENFLKKPEKWQSPKSGEKVENPANLKRKQKKPLQI
jgi:hypothetical protein